MSHFTLMVVTEKKPTDDVLSAALMPYHEFECTGFDNQYVQQVDETEAHRADWNNDTTRRLRDPDGALHEPYDDRFYRDPTPEEKAKIGPLLGTGCTDGFLYCSKDWQDGLGYRAKVAFVPDGWAEVDVPLKEAQPFAEYAADAAARGRILSVGEAPDLTGCHKYGWVRVGDDGEVIEIVRRTNPNAKWDWWVVGGRWGNHLLLKDGTKADSARKGDVDFEGMMQAAGNDAAERWKAGRALIGDLLGDYKTWDVVLEDHNGDRAAANIAYAQQRAVQALRSSRDLCRRRVEEFTEPMEKHVSEARVQAVLTFAVLVDGQWMERGKMGWWCVVSDEKADWRDVFQKILSDIPDDHWLTIVDCHI